MRIVKTVEVEDLHEELFRYSDLLTDELGYLLSEYEKLLPGKPDMNDESEEADKWIDKLIKLEDKYQEIILEKVYKALTSNLEEE